MTASLGAAPQREGVLAASLRFLMWSAAAVCALALAGYALYVPRTGAATARRAARQELTRVLDAGEVPEQSAYASQRHWWSYFHDTHGVLAATERRLIWVGVAPRGLIERDAGDPAAFDVKTFAYDSVTAVPARSRLWTGRGLALSTRGARELYAVSAREWPNVRRVTSVIERRQATLRAEAERERKAQEYAAWLARQPVYHVVQRGEALSTIAVTYNITPDSLRLINELTGDRIKVGQRLLVKPGR
ncbi:MAG: LysM peptidoglycan-binding domain-containing protein [Gemmatimonadaceae bacterium]